jgi:hypothetical protein
MVGGAVHVDVEHGGREQRAAEIVMLLMLRQTVSAGAEAVNYAVLNEQPWVDKDGIRQHQGAGG